MNPFNHHALLAYISKFLSPPSHSSLYRCQGCSRVLSYTFNPCSNTVIMSDVDVNNITNSVPSESSVSVISYLVNSVSSHLAVLSEHLSTLHGKYYIIICSLSTFLYYLMYYSTFHVSFFHTIFHLSFCFSIPSSTLFIFIHSSHCL